MKYLNVQYKKFESKRRYGVELETDGKLKKSRVQSALKTLSHHDSYVTKYQLSDGGNSWHVKDDATCGPQGRKGQKGVEVASFVGQGIADLQHIAEVADGLQKIGCQVNKNCGLHIHAEAIDISPTQMGVILAHWLKIEDILTLILPFNRCENEYCLPILSRCKWKSQIEEKKSSKWEPLDLWDLMIPQNIAPYENEERRVNLNLVNYARALHYSSNYRKTIELRWPEGTLSGHDIKCWVRLFLNFIDTCRDLPMPDNLERATLEETLTILGLNHSKESFLILSEGLHETKTWFLERIIENMTDFRLMIHGCPVLNYSKTALNEAKNILNLMWEPVKKYT